jgi:hypothetical protein
MTVYVTQHVRRKRDGVWEHVDISAAQQYGDISILLPTGPMILMPTPAVVTLRHKLSGFNDDDYLLFMGDPTVIALAAVMAARANGGRYKALVWDNLQRRYEGVAVDTNATMRINGDD